MPHLGLVVTVALGIGIPTLVAMLIFRDLFDRAARGLAFAIVIGQVTIIATFLVAWAAGLVPTMVAAVVVIPTYVLLGFISTRRLISATGGPADLSSTLHGIAELEMLANELPPPSRARIHESLAGVRSNAPFVARRLVGLFGTYLDAFYDDHHDRDKVEKSHRDYSSERARVIARWRSSIEGRR